MKKVSFFDELALKKKAITVLSHAETTKLVGGGTTATALIIDDTRNPDGNTGGTIGGTDDSTCVCVTDPFRNSRHC